MDGNRGGGSIVATGRHPAVALGITVLSPWPPKVRFGTIPRTLRVVSFRTLRRYKAVTVIGGRAVQIVGLGRRMFPHARVRHVRSSF